MQTELIESALYFSLTYYVFHLIQLVYLIDIDNYMSLATHGPGLHIVFVNISVTP